MGSPISIVGWSSSDKVPGVGGETLFGTGPASASSIPLTHLVVGTKLTAGSATPNNDVLTILSQDDADAKLGAGSEAALMCYAALKANPNDTLYCAPVAEAAGAVAATQAITFSGTWTTAGSWFVRLNGIVYSGGVAGTDTFTTLAAAVAAAINADVRSAFTAVATAGQVVVSVKSKGVRGNAYECFQDTSKLPSGCISSISGPVWVTLQVDALTTYITPTVANGFYYKCTVAGTGGASQPIWPVTVGTTVADGTTTWTCWGQVLTGGLTSFGGGAGTETNTALLAVLQPSEFARISSAENDSSNLAAWRTQLDSQAGPTSNLLQHFIFAVNGTLVAAEALAQTTLNHPRFQCLWQLNGETSPSQVAAGFGALRCATEQTDPDASYDDAILVGVAPQSQRADWPSHATLLSALNNSITPIYTSLDGYAKVCRSIQTRSLNGSTPDYRVYDSSDATTPDFVRRDLSLKWATVFRPSNPRVSDNPSDITKAPPSGVATPYTWNNYVTSQLRGYERGDGFPNAIIIAVDQNLPSSAYDPVGKRIMTAVPVVAAPNQHQIGISVRQTSQP